MDSNPTLGGGSETKNGHGRAQGPVNVDARGDARDEARGAEACLGPIFQRESEFAAAAVVRLRAAQSAMTELLDDAGLGGARPTAVGRTLGLDKTLAWKVARFIEDSDPVDAAKHIPGTGGVEIVLRAAVDFGVAPKHVDAVRDADRALREFVEQHAGDRRTFEAMLAGVARDERVDLEERKAFFRAGSAIWGVRAKSQFLMLALRPSEDDDSVVDSMELSGYENFERLRKDVPWLVRRLHVSTPTGEDASMLRRSALDPAGVGVRGGLPLMTEFCSQPFVEIQPFVGPDGAVFDEIAPGRVGRDAATTCVMGEAHHAGLPRYHAEGNDFGRYVLGVRTPVEAVVLDVLMHESLTNFGPMESYVAAAVEGRPRPGPTQWEETRTLVQEVAPAKELGSPPVLRTTRVSRYSEMARRAFELRGWSMDEFRGYRVEMAFPPAPCELALRCRILPG